MCVGTHYVFVVHFGTNFDGLNVLSLVSEEEQHIDDQEMSHSDTEAGADSQSMRNKRGECVVYNENRNVYST